MSLCPQNRETLHFRVVICLSWIHVSIYILHKTNQSENHLPMDLPIIFTTMQFESGIQEAWAMAMYHCVNVTIWAVSLGKVIFLCKSELSYKCTKCTFFLFSSMPFVFLTLITPLLRTNHPNLVQILFGANGHTYNRKCYTIPHSTLHPLPFPFLHINLCKWNVTIWKLHAWLHKWSI